MSNETLNQGGLLSGIDVSKFQGDIDWNSVAASGVTFAFARALEGETIHDSRFSENWNAMKQAGLIRGAYDFFVVEDSAEAQVDQFVSLVNLEPGDLAPMVDIEQGSITSKSRETATDIVANFRQYVTLIEGHYGIKPIIYTSASFWNQYMDDSFGEYPLWVAEYGVQSPKLPHGWDRWVIWQHSESGKVPGINVSVDLDTFNGNLEDLKQYQLTS